jgi:hypothetical protein
MWSEDFRRSFNVDPPEYVRLQKLRRSLPSLFDDGEPAHLIWATLEAVGTSPLTHAEPDEIGGK